MLSLRTSASAVASIDGRRGSVLILGQDRQREELDPLFPQGMSLIARCFPMDFAWGRFLVVDLARFFGKAGSNVLGLGFHFRPESAHRLGQFAMGGDAV